MPDRDLDAPDAFPDFTGGALTGGATDGPAASYGSGDAVDAWQNFQGGALLSPAPAEATSASASSPSSSSSSSFDAAPGSWADDAPASTPTSGLAGALATALPPSANAAKAAAAQGTQTRAYGRVKAKDFDARDIAYDTLPNGQVKPIQDWTGAPLTNADKAGPVAYDSSGNPIHYAPRKPLTDGTGLGGALTNAPSTMLPQGFSAALPPASSWNSAGVDHNMAVGSAPDPSVLLNPSLFRAPADPETAAQEALEDATAQARQSAQVTAQKFAALGVPATDRNGTAIDFTDGDALSDHLNQTFNQEMASPAANERPLFGGGEFSTAADALRQQIARRRDAAQTALGQHLDTLAQVDSAQSDLSAIQQQKWLQQAQTLQRINAARAAQGQPPVALSDRMQAALQAANAAAANGPAAPANNQPAPADGQPADTSTAAPNNTPSPAGVPQMPPPPASQAIADAQAGKKSYGISADGKIQFSPTQPLQSVADAVRDGVIENPSDEVWATVKKQQAVADAIADARAGRKSYTISDDGTIQFAADDPAQSMRQAVADGVIANPPQETWDALGQQQWTRQAIADAKAGQKSYAITPDNQIQISEDHPLQSVTDAVRDGVMQNPPPAVWDALRQKQALIDAAGWNPKLKAALVGAGRGAAFLAAAPAGAALGALIPGLGEIGVGEVAGGMATGSAAQWGYDKLLAALAAHNDTINSFLASQQLHPGWSTAGEFAVFGAGLPRAAMKAVGSGLEGLAETLAGKSTVPGATAEAVRSSLSAAELLQQAGVSFTPAVEADAYSRAANALKSMGQAYSASGGGLLRTIENFNDIAKVAAANGDSAGTIATVLAKRAALGSASMVAIDTLMKEGSRALGLSDQGQTLGGVVSSALLGAMASGHGLSVEGYSHEQLGDILLRGAAHQATGTPLDQKVDLGKAMSVPGNSYEITEAMTHPLTPAEQEILGQLNQKAARLISEGKISTNPGDWQTKAQQVLSAGRKIGITNVDIQMKPKGVSGPPGSEAAPASPVSGFPRQLPAPQTPPAGAEPQSRTPLSTGQVQPTPKGSQSSPTPTPLDVQGQQPTGQGSAAATIPGLEPASPPAGQPAGAARPISGPAGEDAAAAASPAGGRAQGNGPAPIAAAPENGTGPLATTPENSPAPTAEAQRAALRQKIAGSQALQDQAKRDGNSMAVALHGRDLAEARQRLTALEAPPPAQGDAPLAEAPRAPQPPESPAIPGLSNAGAPPKPIITPKAAGADIRPPAETTSSTGPAVSPAPASPETPRAPASPAAPAAPAAPKAPGEPQSDPPAERPWGVTKADKGRPVESRNGIRGTLGDANPQKAAIRDATGKYHLFAPADVRPAAPENVPRGTEAPASPAAQPGWGELGPEHRGQPVETRDGRTGTLAAPPPSPGGNVALRDAAGNLQTVPAADVRLSPSPEGDLGSNPAGDAMLAPPGDSSSPSQPSGAAPGKGFGKPANTLLKADDLRPHLAQIRTDLNRDLEPLRKRLLEAMKRSATDEADTLKKQMRIRQQKAVEAAREVVAIPAAERGQVTFSGPSPDAIKGTVSDGASIVSAYVKSSLLPTIKTVNQISKEGRAKYKPGEKSIHISTHDTASTVAHEIMHGVEEENPIVWGKAFMFLKDRTRPGEIPQKLNDLSHSNKYKDDEVAIEDEFKKRGGDHYSGKVYPGGSTELLTTGIERLHADPALFEKQDSDYFSFVVNTLRGW